MDYMLFSGFVSCWIYKRTGRVDKGGVIPVELISAQLFHWDGQAIKYKLVFSTDSRKRLLVNSWFGSTSKQ